MTTLLGHGWCSSGWTHSCSLHHYPAQKYRIPQENDLHSSDHTHIHTNTKFHNHQGYIYNYYYTVYSIITHISLHTPVVFGNNVIYIYILYHWFPYTPIYFCTIETNIIIPSRNSTSFNIIQHESKVLVVQQQQLLLQLLGVVRGRLHRGHLRGELRGLGVEEQRQQLGVQVQRQPRWRRGPLKGGLKGKGWGWRKIWQNMGKTWKQLEKNDRMVVNLGKVRESRKDWGKMIEDIGTGEELDEFQSPKLRIDTGNTKMLSTKNVDINQEKGIWSGSTIKAVQTTPSGCV